MAQHKNSPQFSDADIEETKEHIMVAGKELLLAARGALRFCKEYVESSIPEKNSPQLMNFFQRAVCTADELYKSMASVTSLKNAAEKTVKPLFDAMEREMRSEAESVKKTTHPKTGKGPAAKNKRRPSCRKATRKS